MSRIPPYRPLSLAALGAGVASLGLAAPAAADGTYGIPGNNQPKWFGRHSIDSLLIDYQGGGSFTTCAQFYRVGGSVMSHNCGNLDVLVTTPDCTRRDVDVLAWQNDNSSHSFYFNYKQNGC